MSTRVPANVVDGKSPPFPMGAFVGTLTEIKDAWSEDQKNLDFATTFKDNVSTDGTVNVGKRPFTQRIPVISKDESVVDVQDWENTSFILRRGATLLTQLAIAVGAVSKNEDGSADVNMEEFLQSLKAGLYNGRQIGFEVIHENWTSKDKKRSGTSARVANFFAVGGPASVAGPSAIGGDRTRN